MTAQRAIEEWVRVAFAGLARLTPRMRTLKILEEAIELARTCNMSVSEISSLANALYSRSKLLQPGDATDLDLMATLYAYPECFGLDEADELGVDEWQDPSLAPTDICNRGQTMRRRDDTADSPQTQNAYLCGLEKAHKVITDYLIGLERYGKSTNLDLSHEISAALNIDRRILQVMYLARSQ